MLKDKRRKSQLFADGVMPVEAFAPRETDMMLTIREGRPFLKTPQHDPDDRVPEDFVVLMGIASAFCDPQFRAMMKQVVHRRFDEGDLHGLIHVNGRGN